MMMMTTNAKTLNRKTGIIFSSRFSPYSLIYWYILLQPNPLIASQYNHKFGLNNTEVRVCLHNITQQLKKTKRCIRYRRHWLGEWVQACARAHTAIAYKWTTTKWYMCRKRVSFNALLMRLICTNRKTCRYVNEQSIHIEIRSSSSCKEKENENNKKKTTQKRCRWRRSSNATTQISERKPIMYHTNVKMRRRRKRWRLSAQCKESPSTEIWMR